MIRLPKVSTREAARAAHYTDEVHRFALRPWDVLPMFADAYEVPAARDNSIRAESWRRAKAWRDELLAANPDHYDDIGG